MPPKLTLGPILFHWDADTKRDFYARIADESPIDTVYLGEVVCSKRAPFFERYLPDIVERLERGGKTSVFSTLSEVMLPRERKMTTELCAQADRMIEVNNAAGLGAVYGRPHRIGPMMNVYNERTMAHLAARGARHIALPPELPRTVAAEMAGNARQIGVALEVQVFGRIPLALSARCFHARAHGRSKDECQFVCENDPDGLTLTTLGGDRMLAINGIQTLSYGYLNLAAEIEDMLALGIGHFRLSPHRTDMIAVATIFADRLAGRSDGPTAMKALGALGIGPFVNGFWHGLAGHLYRDQRVGTGLA
ncbi:MAG: U32 family peptidase [Sphingobium sp.]|jgi:collagenase-like PrtC family protease|nr:U32 family peptidase [Novosphingobium sp.]MCI1270029.1 U32 family peptidase [Sphingobium sp.]MCI2053917.1 U32 family peptidase [Sphingobium sp.]TXI08671.1 MAG: U32 family peptidase [Novosphingobium sp.]